MNDLKKSITYAEQIYTPFGITKENIFHNKEKVLHIGSGKAALPGTKTIDIIDFPEVDVVHDLDIFPWPFADNSYDLIFAHSVFEHLENQLKTMEEISRILKPGGRLVITVPYFRCVDAFTDSTHTHFFTTQSLNYYIRGSELSNFEYTNVKFKKIGFWYGWPHPSKNILVRLLKKIMNRYPYFYDQYLSIIFPVKILIWELEL